MISNVKLPNYKQGGNVLTHEQLREVMKFHLENFLTADIIITDDTIHQDAISANDGFGSANSKRIYKSFIRWTIINRGHEDKAWPKKWMEMSVTDLSEKLLS